MRTTMRRLALASVGIIAFCLAALLFVRVAGNPLDPFDRRRFDSSAWLADDPSDARAGMARDLTGNHLPPGMAELRVVALLGPPDEVLHGTDDGGNWLRGTETYSYSLGSYSALAHDDNFFYVHFDAAGRVLGTEINGY